MEEGQARINKLNKLLYEAGRMEELLKSMEDKSLQNRLLEEFDL